MRSVMDTTDKRQKSAEQKLISISGIVFALETSAYLEGMEIRKFAPVGVVGNGELGIVK